MVRDHLIEETNILRKIREKLLKSGGQSFVRVSWPARVENALTEAQQMARTVGESLEYSTQVHPQSLSGGSLGNSIQEVSIRLSSKSKCSLLRLIKQRQNLCGNCGFSGHSTGSRTCPAKGKRCQQCGKYNHFARCCLSKQNSEVVNGINSSQGKLRTCSCHIEGVEMQFIVDLGDKVLVINQQTFQQKFKGLSLGPSTTLSAYEGSIIPVLGQVTLSVSFAGRQSSPFSFYVTTKGANLMGVDLFDRLGFQIVDTMTNEKKLLMVDGKVRQNGATFSGTGQSRKIFTPAYATTRCDSSETDNASYTFVFVKKVSEEISRMLSEGIIEHIDTSPWMSNVVIVQEKSGDIRLGLDLRQVSKAVILDMYPFPSLEELMSEFNESTVFSRLDLSQGYLQIPLDEQSEHYCVHYS